jgi:hypothetical protein
VGGVLGQSYRELNAYLVQWSFYRKLNWCCAVLQIFLKSIRTLWTKEKKKDKLECRTKVRIDWRPCRSSSGYSLASHRGDPDLASGQSMWGLWWTKRHWGTFSPSTSVSPAIHSTNYSIIIITRGWHNRPIGGGSAECTQLDSTPPPYKFKKIRTDWKVRIRRISCMCLWGIRTFEFNGHSAISDTLSSQLAR